MSCDRKKGGGGQGGAVVRRKFNSLKPIIYELKDLIFIVIYFYVQRIVLET